MFQSSIKIYTFKTTCLGALHSSKGNITLIENEIHGQLLFDEMVGSEERKRLFLHCIIWGEGVFSYKGTFQGLFKYFLYFLSTKPFAPQMFS